VTGGNVRELFKLLKARQAVDVVGQESSTWLSHYGLPCRHRKRRMWSVVPKRQSAHL